TSLVGVLQAGTITRSLHAGTMMQPAISPRPKAGTGSRGNIVKAARQVCPAYSRRAAAAGWFGRGTPSTASDAEASPVAAFRLPRWRAVAGLALSQRLRAPAASFRRERRPRPGEF